MDWTQNYERIAEGARAVRQQSLADSSGIEAAHRSIADIKAWQEVLVARPEASIFAQIISALELGLFSLVSGLYRQAYGSLRLAVELSAGISWFSTHRLDLAEWQTGQFDLVWREITNTDEGILSPRYRKAFFPEFKEEKKYDSLCKTLYRELSEYVHGNARTWAGPDDIRFDDELQADWLNRLETYLLVATVLFAVRYLQEVSRNDLEKLQPVLRSRVSHVEAIVKYLEEKLQPAAGLQEEHRESPPIGPQGTALVEPRANEESQITEIAEEEA
jgi:hypothetical protein